METSPKRNRDIKVSATVEFRRWFDGLKDRQAINRIGVRLARVEQGNLGDTRFVGRGVWELRIAYGPGYRVYFTQKG
jgi:putative addiction module killer protein